MIIFWVRFVELPAIFLNFRYLRRFPRGFSREKQDGGLERWDWRAMLQANGCIRFISALERYTAGDPSLSGVKRISLPSEVLFSHVCRIRLDEFWSTDRRIGSADGF